MESYTTISVKPIVKQKLKHLQTGGETYGELIEKHLPEIDEDELEELDDE